MGGPHVGKRIKVQGLVARADLNGSLGWARSFDDAAGRYVVQTDGGEALKLKPENVEVVPGAPGGMPGGVPGMGGMPNMSSMPGMAGMSGPQMEEAQRQAQALIMSMQRTLQNTLPGVTPNMFCYGVIALIFGMSWVVGFFRALLFAIGMSVAFFMGAPVAKGKGVFGGCKAVWTSLSNRLAQALTQALKTSPVAQGYAVSPTTGKVLLFFITTTTLYFIFSPLLRRSPPSGTGASSFGSNPASAGPSMEALEAAMEEAYAMGYKDGEEENSYGTSRPAVPVTLRPQPTGPDPNSIPQTPKSSWGMPNLAGLGLSKLLSMGILGKTAYDLGYVPGCGWDAQVMMQNAKLMSPGRMALNGFMLLRLLGLSPI